MPLFGQHAREEAEATVSEVTMLKRVNYGTALVRIVYVVEPPVGPSFGVTREAKVSMAALPQAGHRVRVSYDPGKRQKLEVLTPPGEETGTVTVATVEIPYINTTHPVQSQIAGLDARLREVQRNEPSTLDRLKQLGELRDSGVLTDAEFETEKAKILADA